jgi:hypothetical protein
MLQSQAIQMSHSMILCIVAMPGNGCNEMRLEKG